MRIVAGVWAGKELVSPGQRVRSTAEGVRDGWLALLEPHLAGARVLDLFAGSGALGLEALSRGAAWADFVEDGPEALHALKANVVARRLKAPDAGVAPTARNKAARVFKRDAIPFVQALSEAAYDIAFADPPYGSRKLDLVIRRWREVPFSRILGVEHASGHEVPLGGVRLDFGDVAVTLYGLPGGRGRGPSGPGPARESASGAGRGRRNRTVRGKSPTGSAGKPPSGRR